MNLDESSSFESGIIKNGNECPDAKKSPPNIKKLTPAPFNIIDTSHLYRLGVPSDVILFEAADDNIAAVAGFVLCQGKASVLRMDGAKLKCAAYGPEFGDAKEILPILVKNANKVLLAEALSLRTSVRSAD